MSKTNGNGSSARVEVEERELPVKLSATELLERGEQMAAAELKIEEQQLERTVITTDINRAKKERARLGHVIDSGEEPRMVRCHWQEDFAKNVWRLVRQDTGEQVDTRAMTADDRQEALSIEPEQGFTAAASAAAARPRSRKRTSAVAVADLGSAVPPPRTPKRKAAAKKATTQNANA